MVGNPAKQIGWMSKFGHKLKFDLSGTANCLESNDIYKLVDNNVICIEY
jgi:UDP-2-acetamido-3-amino-2,3-dideoxy-glucuronate N-acetyltransferase